MSGVDPRLLGTSLIASEVVHQRYVQLNHEQALFGIFEKSLIVRTELTNILAPRSKSLSTFHLEPSARGSSREPF